MASERGHKILSVGIPSGFENGLFQLGKLLLLSMIATFGTAITAANTVGNTLGSFQCLPGNAIGLAMIAVVGQCCSAHAYDQAKFYTKKLMQIVYLCMGTLNILMLLCNPIITLPFNLSPEATVLARQIVALHGAGCVIFWPMSFTMPNALRAAGDAKYTMRSRSSRWRFFASASAFSSRRRWAWASSACGLPCRLTGCSASSVS